MGWWSPTILGGDPPLDAQSRIEKIAGLHTDDWEREWDDDPVCAKQALEAVTMEQWQAELNNADPEEAMVSRQVCALMHMQVGARLPEPLAKLAIDACANMDWIDWKESGKRREHLQAFAMLVRSYDGTPVRAPEETLAERFRRPGP